MHRSNETQMQLRSAANAADRRNRPAMLVIGPAALLILTLLYLLWSFSGYAAAGREYAAAAADTRGTFASLQELLQSEETSSDVNERYQVNAYLLTDIGDTESSDGEQGHARAVGLRIDRIENKGTSITQRNEPIAERSVNVYITGQELETILAWIDACLNDPRYKGRLYVKSINLRPNRTNGWDAQPVTLAIYEKNDK